MNSNLVTLRALEPEDLELIYRIENDHKLWKWGASNVPYSHYTIRQYLEGQHNDIFQDGQLRQVIMADSQPVGIADLTDFAPLHSRAEVGIVVLQEHQRQGIATAALQQLHHYASQMLHLRSLYAYVDIANQPAQALFSRLGYTAKCELERWISGAESATLFQRML